MSPHFQKKWFNRHRTRVWAAHLWHLRDRPARYLEIGVLEGRSMCWVMEALLVHPESTAVGIDLWRGSIVGWRRANLQVVEARARENVAPYGERVRLIQGTSARVLGEMVEADVPKFDLIYIDGSHEPKDVLVDSCLSWKLVASGGIVIWDDYDDFEMLTITIEWFHRLVADQSEIVFSNRRQLALRKTGSGA